MFARERSDCVFGFGRLLPLLHDGNLLGNDLLLNFCMKTFPVNCSFLMFLRAGNSSMFQVFFYFSVQNGPNHRHIFSGFIAEQALCFHFVNYVHNTRKPFANRERERDDKCAEI